MNHVVCVKWGNKYVPQYVNVLASMVKRHTTVPYQFHCITEDATGLDPTVNVVQLPNNPIINVRSFSENPSTVSLYATQYILGLQENGLLATAKHFPGHGDTETDSHSSLAMIPSDSSRLWEIENPPFQDMIEKGIDAIMVAHVHSPDYQPDSYTPASMSKFWVNDILKEKLEFRGAIEAD